MASSRPAKQLKELLQEQQEPFMLATYVSERRYRRSSLTLDSRIDCCPKNSATKLKRSTFHSESSTKRERIANGSSVLRSVLNKIVSKNECCKLSIHDVAEVQKSVNSKYSSHKSNIMSNHLFFKHNCGSSFSASTFQTFEPFDMGGLKAATDGNLQCTNMDDRLLSPISVLETLPSNKAQHLLIARQEEILSTSSLNLQKRTTGNSIASASLRELLIKTHPRTEQLEEIFGFTGSSQYPKTKIIMQHTEQVLFNYEKEAIEIHGQKSNVQKNQEFLRNEEPSKNVCKQIYHWEKQCRDATSISKLINSDFATTKQGWSESQPLTMEIEVEIADVIMDQIVTEIINLFF